MKDGTKKRRENGEKREDGAVAEARKLQQRPFSYANMEKLVKKSKHKQACQQMSL